MRTLLTPLLLASLLFLAGCAAQHAPTSAGTPQNPPFPATPSILPLATGNSWTYSLTAYDSMGRKIAPSRVELTLALPGGYGLVGDTQLVTLTWQNRNDSFTAYVYKYEWDNRDSGALVVHRGGYQLDKRGLYVIGRYLGNETHLFPSEKLWLAYPADSGKTWQFNPDSAGDSASAVTMEILSTRASFFVADPQTMTAGSFVECYLYKETGADFASYYYYNPDIGCVGYLGYSGGKLRESYYLKQFKE
jgi:hypothetical protein